MTKYTINHELYQQNCLALAGHIPNEMLSFFKENPEPFWKISQKYGIIQVLNRENKPIYAPNYLQNWQESWQFFQNNLHQFHFNQGFKTIKAPIHHQPRNEFAYHHYEICANYQDNLQEPALNRNKSGFILIFSLGLGDIFHQLADEYRDIIIIDDLVNLHLSLFLVNWQEIISKLAKDNGKIIFVPIAHDAPQVQDIANILANIIQYRHAGLLEFSGYFGFLHNPVLTKFIENIQEFMGLLSWFNGWLEDEYNHYTRIKANLAQNPQILSKEYQILRPYHALIVGAGPSLDKEIALLKTNRHKFVIFSCGSALIVLLKHGITPNYHVELENSETIIGKLAPLTQEYDLSAIELCASLTVPPEIRKFFGKTSFFLREGNGMAGLFANFYGALEGSGRSVACSALSIAIHEGFQRISFLGLDLAFIDGLDHAKMEFYESQSSKDYFESAFGQLMVQGNFTHQVKTNRLWLFFLDGLKLLIQKHLDDGYKFINCSHGAMISGAKPMKFSELCEIYSINNELFTLNYQQNQGHDWQRFIANQLQIAHEICDNLAKNWQNNTDLLEFYDDFRLICANENNENNFINILAMEYQKIFLYYRTIYNRLNSSELAKFNGIIKDNLIKSLHEFQQIIAQTR